MSTEDSHKIYDPYSLIDKRLLQDTVNNESREPFPYVDTTGNITIGIGHNLTGKGLPPHMIDELFVIDMREAIDDLDHHLKWWRGMSENRQRVILDMCFNLGIVRLLGFHTTLKLMSEGNFEEASRQMLRSRWAKQVKGRAQTLSRMMRIG